MAKFEALVENSLDVILLMDPAGRLLSPRPVHAFFGYLPEELVGMKIIETMGGTIWVESEVGKGSVFCFSVPAAAPAVAVPPSGAPSPAVWAASLVADAAEMRELR